MRIRSGLFWGLILLVLATLLLLRQLQLIRSEEVFGYFWPSALILFGVWMILAVLTHRKRPEGEYRLSIPLEAAASARIKLDHGAGRLTIGAGAGPGELLNGVFGSEVETSTRRNNGELELKLRHAPQFWAWSPGDHLDWDIRLNGEIPICLEIDTGASSSVIDLSGLKVTDLDVDTGASSTEVTLPALDGTMRVDIDSGAASLNLHIPQTVAARIQVKSGVAAINIDTARFPSQGGGLYQSPDYASAAQRADITIDTGVGSVNIQ